MRLLRLDLERYGAFTGRSLSFRADARLHVVLGANEAGKSTALAAVTDLLFGIEARTRYAFLHEMPQMRLGAEIRAGDGRRLAFRRRKGNRNTLVDAADAPLPDDALAPFLGGLTRAVFCRAFGLDAGALRAGAAEMLDAEGELGASLFAAASGLRGYRSLQERLESEAAGIFTPRAAKDRTFYQALNRYEEARRAIRGAELRAGDWRDLNEEIEEAGRRLEAIRAERQRVAAEQARLARLRRVGPLIRAIDAVPGDDADALLPAGALSDAWADALGGHIAAAAAAQDQAARAAESLARAEADLAALPVDAGLLARADAVFEAFRGVDRHDKGAQDLPRLLGEADGFAQDLARLAVRVGLPDAEALRARQPSDALHARLGGLLREGRALAAEIARLVQEQTARADQAAAAARADRDGAEGSDPAAARDPRPLRADLRAFAGLPAEIARREELDRAVRREAGLLWLQAGRLVPPVPDLAALAQGALPAAETVARHRGALEALERRRDRALDRREAADRLVADTRLRLRLREGDRPLPSPADLARLRAVRDRLIEDIPAASPPDGGAAARAAVAEADAAADAMLREAARAAEIAADRVRLEAVAAEAEAAAGALAACADEIAAADAAWRAVWQPVGVAPASPAEMAAWLAEVEGLIEALQLVEAQSLERDHLDARIDAARAPLAALAGRAGLDLLPDLPVPAVLARLEERVAALAEVWESARGRQATARAAAEEAQRVAAALAAARTREAGWRAALGEALPRIGLAAGAGLDEAESALVAWQAVPPALDRRDAHRRRIAGLERDMAAYRGQAEALSAALAPDLAGLPATAAVKALHERLREALDAQARRRELARHRDEALLQAEAAAAAVVAAGTALARHLAEAGAATEDPAGLHARLAARRALRDARAARRADLARVAEGVPEAALRAELAATAPEAVEAALGDLALEAEDLDRRSNAAFADRDRAERRREALEGGTGAELALAQRKAAEAELQGEARNWAVLRLAGLLLGTAIARQRAGQQDPLLARAGALFAALTGGAFAGLGQEYDAGDTPRLAGRRAGGELVPVEVMSEGTRDQLYLALRLAYLEDYAARSEPAPFVGDDLFLTFDDARTAHGLEALAAVGARVQPILFTHHRHVADLARARLGAAVDVIDL